MTHRSLLNELVQRWRMAIDELTEGNLASALVTTEILTEVLTNTNFRQGEPSILHIRQPPVLASVLDQLNRVERVLLRKPAPPQLKRELQERVMEASRLKLITLPGHATDSGSIEEIMKPLAEEVVTNQLIT